MRCERLFLLSSSAFVTPSPGSRRTRVIAASPSILAGVLLPGTWIDRYELLSPVGEGGIAQVWIARQKGKHGFERLFALKCIHTRFADEPAFRARFLDEARIAASLEHPNIARVFDLGEADSLLYLVMEYVDGESLSALMTSASRRANRSVTVPTAVALRVMADACAGLHAAHSLKNAASERGGVVHGEVSPHNIIVSVSGEVKVIEFGIAHAKGRIGGDVNQDSLEGNVHCMAPEQALREPIGGFTDVFAAGATLYRMLVGHPPFEAGSDAATLRRLLGGQGPDPMPETIPPLVAAIVLRALAHDPGDRYASAREMQHALEEALRSEKLVASVAAWVTDNLSEAALQRRAALASRQVTVTAAEPIAFVAELALPPERSQPATPSRATSSRAASAGPAALAYAPVAHVARAVQVAPMIATVGHAMDPAPTHDSAGPGMLDVRALVAQRAASAARGPLDSAPEPAPSSGKPSASPPEEREQGVAPAEDVSRPKGPTTQQRPAPAPPRGSSATKIALVSTGLVILVLGVGVLLLPMIVRGRILAAASEAQLELTVERVSVGIGGITLRDVTARTNEVPGVELRAEEIVSRGVSSLDVRVRGLRIQVHGHVSEVAPAALAYYERNRARLAGSAGEPRTIAVFGAHLVWGGALGEGTRVDAEELGADFESRSVGTEQVRMSVGRFDVTTKHTLLGPWAGTFDRSAGTARLRLLLDPPVPDGPSALVVFGATPTHLTVNVARSPLARLGIRPSDLGLPVDSATEVELKLEGGSSANQRIEGRGRFDVYGVRLRGLKAPVDMKLEGAVSGLPGRPLELERTAVTLGPFLANVTGTITPTESGFRLDAGWRTVPVACEKLARAEARALGPVAAALQDVARATGVVRVTGTMNASGLLKYDTLAPDEGSVTVVTREACGLSIFGF